MYICSACADRIGLGRQTQTDCYVRRLVESSSRLEVLAETSDSGANMSGLVSAATPRPSPDPRARRGGSGWSSSVTPSPARLGHRLSITSQAVLL